MPNYSAHHRIRLKKLTKRQKELLIKRSVLIVAIVEPIMTLPQIYEVWVNHQTAGVSLLTWGMYIVAAFIWLLYGLQLRDKPLVISSFLWVVTEAAVVTGVLFA